MQQLAHDSLEPFRRRARQRHLVRLLRWPVFLLLLLLIGGTLWFGSGAGWAAWKTDSQGVALPCQTVGD